MAGMASLQPHCAAESIGSANSLFMTLISALVTAHCNISTPDMWPRDYGEEVEELGLDPYDYIIVGAGASGSVVASRLSDNQQMRVLLLEAGADPAMESQIPGLKNAHKLTQYDWNYPTIPNSVSCLAYRNEACTYMMGRMLGGSMGLGGMQYMRGNTRDYDNWAHDGNTKWGWKNLLPYFLKSEDFRGVTRSAQHGFEGPIPVDTFRGPREVRSLILKAADELGYNIVNEFIEEKRLGFGRVLGFVNDGRRANIARAFVTGKRPNLDVIKNAVATKIQFSRGKRADAVHFVHNGISPMVASVTKEVIISAGAIETPKLLLLSGIGPEMHLRGTGIPVLSNVRVGDNLQDHTRVDLFFKYQRHGSEDSESELLDAIYNQWIHRSGPLSLDLYDVTGYIHTNRTSRFPDVQYFFRPIRNISEIASNFKPVIRLSLEQQIGPNDRVFAASVTFLKPDSRGFIRLRSSNYQDKPIVIPNSFSSEIDIKGTIRGIMELTKFEITDQFKNVNGRLLRIDLPTCDNYEYKSVKYWSCYIKYMSDSLSHVTGTVKMGPSDDREAVVDQELRVRGVRALRVIDASVMPTIPSGGTAAAAIMIGEKGADLLKATWNPNRETLPVTIGDATTVVTSTGYVVVNVTVSSSD